MISKALPPEKWDRVFAVNVRGVFQVTRAAAPLLKKARGSIVNTASIVGLRPGPQPLPYAASKAAVVSLTKLAGAESGAGDSRERGGARMDGRRMDGADAEG